MPLGRRAKLFLRDHRDEQMAAVRILLERLLHLKSEAVKTTPHIRMTGG